MEGSKSMNFRDFIASLDVVPPSAITPGEWQRCSTLAHPRKKNASIKLVEGEQLGFVQDFSTMAEPCIWRANGASKPVVLSQDEIKSRVAAKRRELIEATKSARSFYESCKPLRSGHPYLMEKGLDMAGCDGLKIDHRGNLVVPMRLNGSLISVQRITEDGTKLFWSGATTNGTSYVIDRKGAAITLVCEGLATGLTLFGCFDNCRVIVAFNAGNLARSVAHHSIIGLCSVCADNDKETEKRIGKNPGVEGAQKAADTIGCEIVIPLCDAGTDFDDWRQELLVTERQKNLFRSWKATDHQMLANARGVIKSHITSRLKYITPNRYSDSLIEGALGAAKGGL